MRRVENASSKATNAVRDVSTASHQAGNAVRKLGDETETTGSRFSRLMNLIRTGMRSSLAGLVAALAAVIAKVAALGVLGQGIGALAGGIVALLPRIADLGRLAATALPAFTGLGLAMVTLKLGLGGISEALGGNKEAMKNLTGEGRALVRTLRGMRGVFNEFKRSAQEGLFGGIRDALRGIRRARPEINQVLRGMSEALGGIITRATERFTQRDFLRDFVIISGQGTRIVSRFGDTLINLVDGLRHIAIAARPLTEWLSRSILQWSQNWAIMQRNRRASGELTERFLRTKESLEVLWRFARNVWRAFRLILETARPLGDRLWGAANRSMEAWLRVHDTIAGRQGLIQGFLRMEDSIRAIMRLAAALGRAFFEMGQSQALPKTVDSLTRMVPALERILNTMADTFGPPMANAIGNILKLFADLSSGTGPLVGVVKLIGDIAGLLDKIVNLGGPIGDLFKAAFQVFLIQAFLIKLGLIERGWWRVAAAASAAGTAQVGAMGGGVAGAAGAAGGARRGGILGRIGGAVSGVLGGIGLGSLFGRGRGAGGAGGIMEGIPGAGPTFGPAAPGGVPGAAGRAGIMGGMFGGIARVIPQIALFNAALGMLTEQPWQGGGGAMRGIGRTIMSGLSGLTFGLSGAIPGVGWMGRQFESPEQRSGRMAQKTQQAIERQLQATAGIRDSLTQATQQLHIFQRAAESFQDDRTRTGQEYLASLREEIAARRAAIDQIKAERSARAEAASLQLREQMSQFYRQQRAAGVPARRAAIRTGEAALDQIAQMRPSERQRALSQHLGLMQADVRRFPQLAPVIDMFRRRARQEFGPAAVIAPGLGARLLRTPLRGRSIFTGTPERIRAMRHLIATTFGERRQERRQQGLTVLQRALMNEFIAAAQRTGLRGPRVREYARQQVLYWTEGQFRGGIINPMAPPSGQRVAADSPGPQPPPGMPSGLLGPARAAGGRIPGKGLRDTVPVGGAMAAPGELIVNRHTEGKVNSMLNGATLGGLVGSETRRHDSPMQSFAAKEGRGTGLMPGLATGGRYFAKGGRRKGEQVRAQTLAAVRAAANALDAAAYPYTWAGGHNTSGVPSPQSGSPRSGHHYPGIGYDCSGSTRAVLLGAGYNLPAPMHSSAFNAGYNPRVFLPGEAPNTAAGVTIYYNNDHVFLNIGGRQFSTSPSVGPSDKRWKGEAYGGPGWISPRSTSQFGKSHLRLRESGGPILEAIPLPWTGEPADITELPNAKGDVSIVLTGGKKKRQRDPVAAEKGVSVEDLVKRASWQYNPLFGLQDPVGAPDRLADIDKMGQEPATQKGKQAKKTASEQAQITKGKIEGADWVANVLRLTGSPTTAANVAFMKAWGRQEGGHTNAAKFNWLNTSRVDNYGGVSAGIDVAPQVQRYPDFKSGVRATADTLLDPDLHPYILAGLRGGKPPWGWVPWIKDMSYWGGHGHNPDPSVYVDYVHKIYREYGVREKAATGRRLKWAGWQAQGMDSVFNQPTLIGVGEKGKERVTVTPQGARGQGANTNNFNLTVHVQGGEPGRVQREVQHALQRFAQELDRQTQLGQSPEVWN